MAAGETAGAGKAFGAVPWYPTLRKEREGWGTQTELA